VLLTVTTPDNEFFTEEEEEKHITVDAGEDTLTSCLCNLVTDVVEDVVVAVQNNTHARAQAVVMNWLREQMGKLDQT